MKKIFFIIGVILTMAKGVQAQTCQVPVSEADEPMMKGKFEPTWGYHRLTIEEYQMGN